MRTLIALVCLCLPTAAPAQDGPAGIAFVQAPEQSSGMAIGPTPALAFEAAIAECVAGGALAADCLPTNWCQPAGWSVDVFVQHVEGIHWHEVVCGLPEEAVALSVAAALCNRDDRPWVALCDLTQVYDPQGVPQL
ncbi:MAG: hypothetical protein H6898_11435 [Rhodobacter sp.]|nr:hypothetical protein [Paracoccaceae bacterium]MCC0077179.1 hypothetical protein [Rhodobacter sp.]